MTYWLLVILVYNGAPVALHCPTLRECQGAAVVVREQVARDRGASDNAKSLFGDPRLVSVGGGRPYCGTQSKARDYQNHDLDDGLQRQTKVTDAERFFGFIVCAIAGGALIVRANSGWAICAGVLCVGLAGWILCFGFPRVW